MKEEIIITELASRADFRTIIREVLIGNYT